MKKKMFVFVPVFLVFVVIFTVLTPSIAMSESISNKVFRLHILANSDSDDDQNLKLKVRDAVLDKTREIYTNCNTIEDAISESKDNITVIQEIAQQIVYNNGYDYKVDVEITVDYFDTREYDDFTLPAGLYNCLRIKIGSAKGHNWWCVMFPAVCVSGCSEDLSNVLTKEEQEMVEKRGYIVKFKAVEVYEKIKSKFIS